MSKFYGTLVSDKGISTRAGHKTMAAAAQSHDGSVIVELKEVRGLMRVEVAVSDKSDISGRVLLDVPLEELVAAQAIALATEEVAE